MQERKFRKGCGRYEPKGKSACPTDKTAVKAASQPLNKLLYYIKDNREIYLLFLHQPVDKEFRSSLMELAMHLIMDKFAFSETETDNEERTIYLMNGSIALIDEWLEKGAVIPVEEVTELLLKYSNAVFRC